MGGIVPAREGLIVGQFRLHTLKLLLTDNRWNLGDGNPLLTWRERGRVMRMADGMSGRAANLGRMIAHPSRKHLPGIGWIGEQAMEGGEAPAWLAGRRGHALFI